MKAAPPRPAWDVVRIAALQEHNIARVVAGLGFDRVVAEFRRGELAWWLPTYWTTASPVGRFLGREPSAELNRALRDSRVLMLLRRDPQAVIYLDTDMGGGCWRDLSGAQRGDCIISLAMVMLKEPRFGRAAMRLARLCGLGSIPVLPAPLGIADYVSARLQRAA